MSSVKGHQGPLATWAEAEALYCGGGGAKLVQAGEELSSPNGHPTAPALVQPRGA